MTPLLTPHQLGVGTSGGCEAAVHATRRFLSDMAQDPIMVKLDNENAFNSFDRVHMLTAIIEELPEIAAYCHVAYAEPSDLKFGHFTIKSQMDPQQGDPLGPMLFSLPLQKSLRKLKSQLGFGYLDVVTMGGRAQVVATDVQRFEEAIASLGLKLNQKKCELIAHSTQFSQLTQLRQFTFTNQENATLLGSSLLEGAALEAALDTHNSDLAFALKRFTTISRHHALLILRISLGSPRLLYTLRTAPCAGHQSLARYDALLRTGLEKVLNITFTESSWTQATLPTKRCGLGIRRVPELALPAFIASAASTLSLQDAIIRTEISKPYNHLENLMTQWIAATNAEPPELPHSAKQRIWDCSVGL